MTEEHGHIVGYGTFIAIWVALMVLTGVTVAVSRVDLGAMNIWAALGIASFKSGLVIAFFMHMKYEGRLLRFSLFAALVTLAIFIGFTFFDVLYR